MSKIRIQCSPLTENIYAGRVNKAGTAWAGEKTDVTSDVLGAVIQKIGAGNIIAVNENGKPAFEIEVRTASEMPSSAEDSRAAFEKWADSLELDLTRVHAGDYEVYSDCNTDHAWMAWQAAKGEAK